MNEIEKDATEQYSVGKSEKKKGKEKKRKREKKEKRTSKARLRRTSMLHLRTP